MEFLTMNNYGWTTIRTIHGPNCPQLRPISKSTSWRFLGLLHNGAILHCAPKFGTRTFARRKSAKKVKRDGKSSLTEILADKSSAEIEFVNDNSKDSPVDKAVLKTPVNVASRNSVLQACTFTSGLIAALGIIIRQVSHVATVEGLPVLDCSTEVSFGFEIWHLELIVGLVILISSCRYLLLKTWPDFSESSEAANQQVLTSLEPLDYLVVATLPGFSEELLFRGGLLPLFGIDWRSCLFVAAIFGVLHLGSGRKYSFAIWATFVGFAYGYATIASRSLIVPMTSHALNNLVGGILWRMSKRSE